LIDDPHNLDSFLVSIKGGLQRYVTVDMAKAPEVGGIRVKIKVKDQD